MNKPLAVKIALRGLLIATAFVLSWVEMQIPYFFAVPGIKLGLTNLVVLLALYKLSPLDAFAINMLRILLVSFTFGSFASLPYAAVGGFLSFFVMLLLKKLTSSSLTFISVAGGISHNAGQILVAMFILDNVRIAYYLPLLWISGIVAGIAIGLMCGFVIRRIPEYHNL